MIIWQTFPKQRIEENKYPARTSSESESGPPNSSLTATAAAAAEAAEDPRPDPNGRPLWRVREMATDLTRRARMTAKAAIPAQFTWGSRESLDAEGTSEVMEEMEREPGGDAGSIAAVTVSPREDTAHPRKSKPGPRLATVAGAKAERDVKSGGGSGEVVVEERPEVWRETQHRTVARRRCVGDRRWMERDREVEGERLHCVVAAAAMIW